MGGGEGEGLRAWRYARHGERLRWLATSRKAANGSSIVIIILFFYLSLILVSVSDSSPLPCADGT